VSFSNGSSQCRRPVRKSTAPSTRFHYVYQPLLGDGTITARVVSLQGGSGYVTTGVMIRETLNSSSANAKTADWTAFGGIYFDVRTTTSGSTSEPGVVSATPALLG